jgi:FKBP-type peptidyl-prolyl cis-trans isomerase
MSLKLHIAAMAVPVGLAFSGGAVVGPAGNPMPAQQVNTAWLNRQMSALAERHSGTGWHVTASGLRWRQIAGDGRGVRPGAGSRVTVHYAGSFVDGSEFDSSIARGEPLTFSLDQVIPGWSEGVRLMGVGDKFEFAIPYQLGYGATGRYPIPGGATLLFTVELLAVEA